MPSSKFAVYLWPVEAIKVTLKTIPLTLYGKIGGFVEEPFFNDRIHIPYPQNVV